MQRPVGRILVVDDEEVLLRIIRKALGPDHELTCTVNPEEAHRQITDGARFDLILCDLMMPKMTGMDLHAAITVADPAQADRIVFLTGGAFTVAAQSFLDRVPNVRVAKPFNVVALKSLIGERLKASGGR